MAESLDRNNVFALFILLISFIVLLLLIVSTAPVEAPPLIEVTAEITPPLTATPETPQTGETAAARSLVGPMIGFEVG
ncbi:MAG: hypothetical protein GYB67_10475 [Chloroflexi bacterium]|nr:hypothetical protein [Chloroflexota bacterium]